ncbi:homeobox protein 13 isoform X5 [Armigeres subalbatus]|uniref:homeobox protein 13 isoform X5 n=1 Tax=Armigeres subalbatus TaxID=124917 RepID=UPI002ED3616F
MGTETVCGSYYSEQQAGNSPAMNSYYQMSNGGSGGGGGGGNNAANDCSHGSNNQPEDEAVGQGVANSDDQGESELDLRHQDQQRSIHNEPPRNPPVNVSNPWSISQQIQNHISNNPSNSHSSRLERSNSLASNWTFPSYQRLYNENHYGIAIAAAVQHQLPGTSQPQSLQNNHLTHNSNPSSQHHQQQQNQQHPSHHQQLQQQQPHQQHPNHLMSGGINGGGGGGIPTTHSHLSKRFYYQTPTVFLFSGKSSNNKDICGDDKHKEDGDPWNVEAQAAFLGPNLWDKTLPYDSDLKVHQYADLDEFLSENGIPVDGLPSGHLGHSTSLTSRSDSLGHCAGLSLGLSQVTTKRERSPSPTDCMSPDTINPPSPADSTFSMSSATRDFDPRTRAFSDEELKPQPMIKKSRKQFVPDDMKDDKYWARRRKNNMAAKRSRDARRMKENQIALRAGYLEKENMNLHREVEQLKQENMELRARLSKYQEV